MKKINTILFAICISVCFIACEKEDSIQSNVNEVSAKKSNKVENINKSESPYKSDIAFFDQRVRTINLNEYVKEVVLVSFGNSTYGDFMSSTDTRFVDDGSGYDAVSNDGVYTSIESYSHDSNEPFVSIGKIKSVLDDAIVDSEFAYESELEAYALEYEYRDITDPTPDIIHVECDIEFNVCGGCLASDFWGVCDCCCIRVYNCTKVTFGF